jgi:hypothetical protein
MINAASNMNAPTAKVETAAKTKQIALKEIGAKWGKFSEQELSALKNKDDLVTQVIAKYGLEKSQAQRDKIKATSDWIQAVRAGGERHSFS